MRLVWPGALVLGMALLAVARGEDDDAGLKPPVRGMTSVAKEREERDRVLDMAQQLRSKAAGLHNKADELRQKAKDDEAAKIDDQADTLEDRADQMDEAAQELDEAASGKGSNRIGLTPPKRD